MDLLLSQLIPVQLLQSRLFKINLTTTIHPVPRPFFPSHFLEADFVLSSCVLSFWSGLVWSGLVWSGLVWSGLVWSGLVWSGLCHVSLTDHLSNAQQKAQNMTVYLHLTPYPSDVIISLRIFSSKALTERIPSPTFVQHLISLTIGP